MNLDHLVIFQSPPGFFGTLDAVLDCAFHAFVKAHQLRASSINSPQDSFVHEQIAN